MAVILFSVKISPKVVSLFRWETNTGKSSTISLGQDLFYAIDKIFVVGIGLRGIIFFHGEAEELASIRGPIKSVCG